MTLRDLLDPKRLADFMEWPFEDREIPNSRYSHQTTTIKAEDDVKERWQRYTVNLAEQWQSSPHNQFKGLKTHAQYVQQCVREEKAYQAKLKKRKGRKRLESVMEDCGLDPFQQLRKLSGELKKPKWKKKPMPNWSKWDYKTYLRWCAREEFDLDFDDLKDTREVLCRTKPDLYSPPTPCCQEAARIAHNEGKEQFECPTCKQKAEQFEERDPKTYKTYKYWVLF